MSGIEPKLPHLADRISCMRSSAWCLKVPKRHEGSCEGSPSQLPRGSESPQILTSSPCIEPHDVFKLGGVAAQKTAANAQDPEGEKMKSQ